VKKLATQLYERSREDYKKLNKIRKAVEGWWTLMGLG
jgi:hypothetical protein